MDAVTEQFLDYANDMAAKLKARAILVSADVFSDPGRLAQFVKKCTGTEVVLATRQAGAFDAAPGAAVIKVPDVRLTRQGQIKIAILVGFSGGMFRPGDRLVCLAGISGTGRIDSIVFVEVGAEFEIMAPCGAERISEDMRPGVFERVLDIAISLGSEGREGRPVGTMFVIGDTETVLRYSGQLILNPFRGYTAEERNILDPALEETVKEFSTIDGAFLVGEDGLLVTAGLYLRPGGVEVTLPRGLGTRHKSAAGITAVTRATAVTVSESSGTVTVFRGGRILMEIEKPHPIGAPVGHLGLLAESDRVTDSGRGKAME